MKPNIAEIRESLDREDDDFQLSRKKLREYATVLIGEVERQAGEIERLRVALEKYADMIVVDQEDRPHDVGQLARETLSQHNRALRRDTDET